MLATAIANADAMSYTLMNSWWYTILAGLSLLGYVGYILRELVHGFAKLISFLARPVMHVHPVRNEFNIDTSSDPTRPNSMEDENAAWVNVTRKMTQLERRAKGGK